MTRHESSIMENIPAPEDFMTFVSTPTLIKFQWFPNSCRDFNSLFIKRSENDVSYYVLNLKSVLQFHAENLKFYDRCSYNIG